MSEKTKRIYHLCLLFLSLSLISGLIFYLQKNGATFSKIRSIRFEFIIFLILTHIANYWLLGMTHKLPLQKHQIFLKFREWFGLCTISDLFNMLLPAKGGTGIRMLYIKDKKGLSMRTFLSLSFAVVLNGLTLLGIVGFVYCHFFLTRGHPLFILLESIFIALSISGFILIFATEAIGKIFKTKRLYSLKPYLTDLKLMGSATLCWVGMFLLYPLKVYLSFKAIGIHLHFADSLEMGLVLLAASLFQILPGNLGVKEIVTAYIGKQYGIQLEMAIFASLADRFILLLFLFPVGFYFYWELFLKATLPEIKLARIGASSLIPLKKRLAKVRCEFNPK